MVHKFNTAKDKIIFLAGLLEGEGCFTLSRNSPRIQVNMTDEDTIRWIADEFSVTYRKMGGKVRRKYTNWKPCYNVTLNGEKAISIMLSIYSLMSKRRKTKIKEIVNIWKALPISVNQKITSRTADFIREEYKKGLSYIKLANKYGLSYAGIWNVVNGRSWSTLD